MENLEKLLDRYLEVSTHGGFILFVTVESETPGGFVHDGSDEMMVREWSYNGCDDVRTSHHQSQYLLYRMMVVVMMIMMMMVVDILTIIIVLSKTIIIYVIVYSLLILS